MFKLIHLDSFSLIGLEGSTKDGEDVVARVSTLARGRLSEIESLEEPSSKGYWGATNDFSRSLKPWGNGYSEGLYLYGLKAKKGAKAPKGWTHYHIPAHDYLVEEVKDGEWDKVYKDNVFYLIPVNAYKLSAAPLDYFDKESQTHYLLFPVVANPIKPKRKDLTAKIAPCGLHCGYCFFECGGCLSGDNLCSYGNAQPDHVCPNVKCLKKKGLKGCYECPELASCHFGFYAFPGNAKASAIYIQKHGKKDFEEATKALLGREKPYYELMAEQGDDEKQVAFLEAALKKKE